MTTYFIMSKTHRLLSNYLIVALNNYIDQQNIVLLNIVILWSTVLISLAIFFVLGFMRKFISKINKSTKVISILPISVAKELPNMVNLINVIIKSNKKCSWLFTYYKYVLSSIFLLFNYFFYLCTLRFIMTTNTEISLDKLISLEILWELKIERILKEINLCPHLPEKKRRIASSRFKTFVKSNLVIELKRIYRVLLNYLKRNIFSMNSIMTIRSF